MDQELQVQNREESNDINEVQQDSTEREKIMMDIPNLTSSPPPISSDKPTSSSAEGSILFAETSTVNHSKLKRRGPLMESRISNTLGSLGESMRKMTNAANSRLAEKLLDSTETFGNFIMWMPEPSLPSRYSGSIEMPSREIQMALIDQYFSERHESIGMFVKYYFYEQLETKGLLITPLLLNVIYAHAARFVKIPGCPKTEVFYHRARRLVDDFMDVPRVSTIIALCLLSLYEASPAIYRPGSYHCRQWQYSGMACRMSLELGLYDDSNVHSSLTRVEIELRRRVFWGCYDLDKFQSGGWERPWMISQTFIRTRYPSKLPEETEDDALLLEMTTAKIRFVKIVEDNLILLTASQAFLGGNCGKDMFLGIHKDNMLANVNENHNKHQQWLQTLSPYLQWTPINFVSVKDVLDLPAPRPMIGHLHLYYNAVSLALIERLPTSSAVKFQSRATAACMTQLAYFLCQTPSYINKFDFIAHVLIAAIKVHIRYLDDVDVSLAQQSWLFFDRSIWCMQLINGYAVIPNCTKFLQQVQNIYGLHMGSNSDLDYHGSAKLSPKKRQRPSDNNNSPSLQKQNITSTIPLISQQQQQQRLNTPLPDDVSSGSNNNKMLDEVQFNDDINQILTGWTSPSSANNEPERNNNNNILHIDNESNSRNSNMIYLNSRSTQIHPQYHHQFSSSNNNSNNNVNRDRSNLSQQSTYSSSAFSSAIPEVQKFHHNRAQSNSHHQQSIWNASTRYDSDSSSNNDILQFDTRDIVVPSQLGNDGSSVSDNNSNNNPAMFQQQQLANNNPRFGSSDDSSLWPQQQNASSSIIDDQDPGNLYLVYNHQPIN